MINSRVGPITMAAGVHSPKLPPDRLSRIIPVNTGRRNAACNRNGEIKQVRLHVTVKVADSVCSNNRLSTPIFQKKKKKFFFKKISIFEISASAKGFALRSFFRPSSDLKCSKPLHSFRLVRTSHN